MNTLGMLKNQRGDVAVRDGVLPQQTAFRILTRHIRLYSVRQLRSSWPHVSCRAQNSTTSAPEGKLIHSQLINLQDTDCPLQLPTHRLADKDHHVPGLRVRASNFEA